MCFQKKCVHHIKKLNLLHIMWKQHNNWKKEKAPSGVIINVAPFLPPGETPLWQLRLLARAGRETIWQFWVDTLFIHLGVSAWQFYLLFINSHQTSVTTLNDYKWLCLYMTMKNVLWWSKPKSLISKTQGDKMRGIDGQNTHLRLISSEPAYSAIHSWCQLLYSSLSSFESAAVERDDS